MNSWPFVQAGNFSLFVWKSTESIDLNTIKTFKVHLFFCFRCRKCGTGGYLLTSTSSHELDSCATDSSVPTNQHGPGKQIPPTSHRPRQLNDSGSMVFLKYLKVLFIDVYFVLESLKVEINQVSAESPPTTWWHHTGCDIIVTVRI